MSMQKMKISQESIKNKAVWNTKETAFFLGISVAMLRELIKKGHIPYFRLGGNGRYKFYAKNIINLVKVK